MPISTIDRKNKLLHLQISKVRQRQRLERKSPYFYNLLGITNVDYINALEAGKQEFLYQCTDCKKLFEYIHFFNGKPFCSNCLFNITKTPEYKKSPEAKLLSHLVKWNRTKRIIDNCELDEPTREIIRSYLEKIIGILNDINVDILHVEEKHLRLVKGKKIGKMRESRLLSEFKGRKKNKRGKTR